MKYIKTIGMISNVGQGRGFFNPNSCAFSSSGDMFMLNSGLNRVTVQTFDEDFLTEFATWYGNKPGDKKLNTPTDLEFDSNDRLYITDEVENAIFIYDVEGNFIDQWGKAGSNQGEFNGPSGLTIDSKDNIYVVDQYNNRVQKFSKDGEFIFSWGEFGNNPSEFNLPWGICVDNSDNIYVADWRNDRVQKFTQDGEFVFSLGTTGRGKEELIRPSDVAVDSNFNIYISDWGNERVVVLDKEGVYVSSERGQSTLTTGWTTEFFESNVDERDTREISNLIPSLPEHLQTPYHESSQSEPLFWGITDLAIDNFDRLYVTELRRHRCQVYE